MIRMVACVLLGAMLLTGCASTGLRSITNPSRPTMIKDGTIPPAVAKPLVTIFAKKAQLKAVYLIRPNSSDTYLLIPVFKDNKINVTGLDAASHILESHIKHSKVLLFLPAIKGRKMYIGGQEPLWLRDP